MNEEKDTPVKEQENRCKKNLQEFSSALAAAILAERLANGEEIEIMTNDGHN